jgi:hypothetical protein
MVKEKVRERRASPSPDPKKALAAFDEMRRYLDENPDVADQLSKAIRGQRR